MRAWRTPQAALAAAVLGAAVIVSVPVYPFHWHLLMHVVGAVIFVGNILVTAAWMALAQRTGNPSVLMFAARAVNRADLLFTGPGVVLVLLNGLALAADRWGGWTGFYEVSWIVAALALFALSGVVWVGFLLRYQFTSSWPRVCLRADRRGCGSWCRRAQTAGRRSCSTWAAPTQANSPYSA